MRYETRGRWIVMAAVSALIFGGCSSARKAPETTTPTADSVIQSFIDASGGAKAYEDLEAFIAEGTFHMPAMGITGAMKIYQQVPDRMRSEVEIPGAGTQVSGVLDSLAWELSVMSGPRILEGVEASSAIRRADSAWPLHPELHYETIEFAGTEVIEVTGDDASDSLRCHRLELIAHDGSTETHFYSVDTGLQVRIDAALELQMGTIEVSTVIGGYREMEGVLMPTKMTQTAMGMTQVMELTDIQLNPEIPPGTFDLPEQIEALRSK